MGLPPRTSLSLREPDRSSLPPAVHPNIVLVFRFLITGLVCLLSLATAILAILVVDYYNSHDPIIRPSWGSLIFLIFLGLFTPIVYFGYNIFLPLLPFIRYGDFLYGLFMVKIELLLQFSMAVLWVSGALAYANDLGGRENCQFDGYRHDPKPANFDHVCDLINYVVPLAYATFGVQTFLFVVELLFGLYTFLLLDQESLNEPHFQWGRRAYDYQHTAPPRSAAIGAPMQSRVSPPPAQSYRNEGRRSSGSRVASSVQSSGRRGRSYQDPEMESVASSQPTSLGSRGRRGAAYNSQAGMSTDEESNFGQSGGLAAAAASRGQNRRQTSTSSRRQRSVDEESGWHLKEDESER